MERIIQSPTLARHIVKVVEPENVVLAMLGKGSGARDYSKVCEHNGWVKGRTRIVYRVN